MPAPDHLGMQGESENAILLVLDHIVEIACPNL